MAGVFVPMIICEFLAEVSGIDDVSMRLKRIRAYVYLLEQELRRIGCFNTELPICMCLLREAIERMKEEAEQCEARLAEREFPAMKKCSGQFDEDGGSKGIGDVSDKKNWLKSAKLWTTPVGYEPFHTHPLEKEESGAAKGRVFKQPCMTRDDGGCMPMIRQQNKGKDEMIMWSADHGAGLSLSMPIGEMGYPGNNRIDGASGSNNLPKQRKPRRCWSPLLHNQFVRALQRLGGAQAATPKQIRDIMQVEGLTNDQVKSHLQKYRIHLRKLPPTSSNAPPPPADPMLLNPLQHQSMEASTSNTATTPPGPLHVGGESMEADEEDKSEFP